MRSDAWLHYRPETGMGALWKVEPGTERTLVQGQQRGHVEAILEDNKRLKSANPSGDGQLGRHEATIPLGLYTEWLHEWVADGVPLEVAMNSRHPEMQRRLSAKLNDPDYRFVRTSEGVF